MYRGDHWHDVPQTDRNEPRPVTPILQSTIENVKAELMDRVPEAVILPESPKDGEIAHVIEAIIRQNHDADGYVKEYRKLVHDLLVGGYCVQEIGYDNALNGGLGGAFIRHVDARSILFDPLTTDAQESRAIFKISLKTREYIEARFPKPLVRWSELEGTTAANIRATLGKEATGTLLVDRMGLLARLYTHGDVAYVGGGFSDGIHSLLEAAAWGRPVIFGPNHRKFAAVDQDANGEVAFGDQLLKVSAKDA